MFIAELFIIAKTWKQPKPQMTEKWIEKMWYTHARTEEYYSFIKKEENPAICNNMDVPWWHYAKWNKSDRKRQILYDLTYMWNLTEKKKS